MFLKRYLCKYKFVFTCSLCVCHFNPKQSISSTAVVFISSTVVVAVVFISYTAVVVVVFILKLEF